MVVRESSVVKVVVTIAVERVEFVLVLLELAVLLELLAVEGSEVDVTIVVELGQLSMIKLQSGYFSFKYLAVLQSNKLACLILAHFFSMMMLALQSGKS